MDYILIQQKARKMFNILQPYCTAIYLGGSITQSYIKQPHDIDFICFADNEIDRLKMKTILYKYINNHQDEFLDNEDWIQTRSRSHEEHAYGSYIHQDMKLLIGEPVKFNFDILGKDRKEYITILKNDKIVNNKRLYQLYRGYLLVTKKTFNLTEQEKEILNLLHDNVDNNIYWRDKILSLIKELEDV